MDIRICLALEKCDVCNNETKVVGMRKPEQKDPGKWFCKICLEEGIRGIESAGHCTVEPDESIRREGLALFKKMHGELLKNEHKLGGTLKDLFMS